MGGVDLVYRTTALVGGEWSASRLCRFTPGEGAPGAQWIGVLVGPRAGLDDVLSFNSSIFKLCSLFKY
jgi:hypothetical protein